MELLDCFYNVIICHFCPLPLLTCCEREDKILVVALKSLFQILILNPKDARITSYNILHCTALLSFVVCLVITYNWTMARGQEIKVFSWAAGLVWVTSQTHVLLPSLSSDLYLQQSLCNLPWLDSRKCSSGDSQLSSFPGRIVFRINTWYYQLNLIEAHGDSPAWSVASVNLDQLDDTVTIQ